MRALLLAGGGHDYNCHDRYGNDLAQWFDGLVALSWPPDRVRVHHADGRPIPTNRGAAVSQPCTPQGVAAGLDWLAQAQDLGLLVASNHGDADGLLLWGGQVLAPDQLRGALTGARARIVLVFGQCHAGVFCGLGLPRTVALAACAADQKSRARPQRDYDRFLHDLGRVALDSSGRVDLASAFAAAVASNPYPGRETPQLDDPHGLAASVVLTFS